MGILRLPAKLALHVLCSCGAICSQAQVMYHSVAASVVVFVSLKYLITANVYTYLPVSKHNQSPSTPASETLQLCWLQLLLACSHRLQSLGAQPF